MRRRRGIAAPGNSIRIETIVPAFATAGQSTAFSITVSYDLQTTESAVIDYCFSGDAVFSDRFTSECSPTGMTGTIVSKGRGTMTINAARSLTETNTVSVFLYPIHTSVSIEDTASDVETIAVV